MPALSSDREDASDEGASFLSSFQPFGVEDLEKSKPRRLSLLSIGNRTFLVASSIVLAILILLLGLVLGLKHARKATPDFYSCPLYSALTEEDVIFFVVGDWGRMGSESQRRAAVMMEQVSKCMKPQFIISTGDNFYPHGLGSVSDQQVQASFTRVYEAETLQVPWYAVLGNHDYGDTLPLSLRQGCSPKDKTLADCKPGCCQSPLWQVGNGSANGNQMGPLWHLQQGAHQVSFPNGLEITFIDTSPFIKRYQKAAWAGLIGGVSSRSSDAVRSQQIALINSLLNSSTATMKIVVGHHPVISYGEHCQDASHTDCEDMEEWLKPLLEKHKVTAYLSGHEHDLQYVEEGNSAGDLPVSYVVSGAGSDVRMDEFDHLQDGPKGTHFLEDDQGFVVAVVRKSHIELFFYQSDEAEPSFRVGKCLAPGAC